MPALVQCHERFVNFAVFLGQGNFMSGQIVGDLKMATAAFEFLEMVGDGFGRDKFVSEKRAQQPAF